MTEATIVDLDARGLDCPMPLLKAKRALNALTVGECLRVSATDSGSVRDFEVFARQSGHLLLSSEELDGVFIHVIEKTDGVKG
ncbi:MAG: sulfurtransferase TusA family protein [Pseudomonadota bacterium]